MLLSSHPVTQRLAGEPSPLGDVAYKHREDLIDALLCAWTAALWARHGVDRCQVLGLPADPAGGAGGPGGGVDGPAGGVGGLGVGAGDPGDGPLATIIVPARPEQRR